MDEYVGRILGDWPQTIKKDAGYFTERFCFVDCRGPVYIHENAHFGFGVKIITAGHDTSLWPHLGRMEYKGVTVEDEAWVTSFCILHNCVIQEHAIVSIGSVVNNMVVPQYAVAVGNPAKIIGYMWHGHIYTYDKFLEVKNA